MDKEKLAAAFDLSKRIDKLKNIVDWLDKIDSDETIRLTGAVRFKNNEMVEGPFELSQEARAIITRDYKKSLATLTAQFVAL